MRPLEIVTIASISLLLVMATFLVVKAGPKQSSFRWIGLFLLLLAVNFGDGMLFLGGFYLDHPRLAGWEEGFVLLYGPLMLFFALSATSQPPRWWTRKWIHLLPFILCETLLVVAFQSLSGEQRRLVVSRAASMDPPIQVFLFQLAVLIHFVAYTLFARRLLMSHEERLKQVYSTRVFNWAKSICHSLIGLLAASVAAAGLLQAGYPNLYLLAVLVFVASTGLVVFYALIQALDRPPLPAVRKATEYSLSAAEIERVSTKIRDYFENEQGFTNPELTIADVASQLAEPVRDVSHVVNHHLARNFYDLVNSYRIRAAEETLATEQPTAATITDVMLRVGFNSKSSFNTQFKLRTGLTPSEYRRKMRPDG